MSRFALGLLVCVAACGGERESLLVAGDLESVYGGGGGGAGFAPSSMDPAVRGTIRGKVSWAGRDRKQRAIDVSPGWCRDNTNSILDEKYIVNPNQTLRNAIVYIKFGLDKQSWDVPSEPVVLDQKDCQYVPHVMVVRVGQQLVIKSSDPTAHNVHGGEGANEGWNTPMTGTGALPARTFGRKEMAKRVFCDVHNWMVSWVAILPHPFWAITGEDGTFTLENVPPGHYKLAVWHEAGLGDEIDIDVAANEDKTHDFTLPNKQ